VEPLLFTVKLHLFRARKEANKIKPEKFHPVETIKIQTTIEISITQSY